MLLTGASWTTSVLLSAVFLALYDIVKKASVRENAVLPTLLCSTLFGCAAFLAGLAATGGLAPAVAAVTPRIVALAAMKSVIVASSWIFTFCALRTLPISIATPIRSSSPALVFILAFFLYGERPSLLQGIGMAAVFAGGFVFSWAGRYEGIDFFRSRAVWCAFGGMACAAVSSIFDKYIFQLSGAQVEPVQFLFQIGLVVVYGLILAGRAALGIKGDRFEWRWCIPFVGILLAASDWLYFTGLSHAEVPVSVASLLRRFSVVITFFAGAMFFHETNLARKSIALAAILAGVVLICLGG